MRSILNYISKRRKPIAGTEASPTRRRVLEIMAAGSVALLAGPAARAANSPAVRWQGEMFGAPVALTLYPADPASGDAALRAVLAEIERLEDVFSLFRPHSALSRLNRTGELAGAPTELHELLAACRELHAASAGAFDPSVQALWQLYSAHFGRKDADPAGPAAADVEAARARVGLQHVESMGTGIRIARKGLALTLNGIAQGYATDRARTILAAHGLPHALVNLGEFAALGPRQDGGSWRVAVIHPEVPWRNLARVALAPGQALATSAPAGTAFDAARRFHHLLDPRTGRCAGAWRSVSVCAPTATLADGLSTALAVTPPAQARALLARYPACSALVLGAEDPADTLGTAFPLA